MGRSTHKRRSRRSAKTSAGFWDAIIAELPADKEIHAILDNYCTHKRNEGWLARYEGRVHFHFTPTSASWLSQVLAATINPEVETIGRAARIIGLELVSTWMRTPIPALRGQTPYSLTDSPEGLKKVSDGSARAAGYSFKSLLKAFCAGGHGCLLLGKHGDQVGEYGHGSGSPYLGGGIATIYSWQPGYCRLVSMTSTRWRICLPNELVCHSLSGSRPKPEQSTTSALRSRRVRRPGVRI